MEHFSGLSKKLGQKRNSLPESIAEGDQSAVDKKNNKVFKTSDSSNTL